MYAEAHRRLELGVFSKVSGAQAFVYGGQNQRTVSTGKISALTIALIEYVTNAGCSCTVHQCPRIYHFGNNLVKSAGAEKAQVHLKLGL
jgi:hypothetical protein